MAGDISLKRQLHTLLRKKLSAFIEKAFATVSPGATYHHNWHIEALGWHLEQVATGKIKRLIITVPPRSLKSISASVAFPAWFLGHNPKRRIICVSYAADLAKDCHNSFRAVMASSWYRELFPQIRIDPRKDTESETRTTARGSRLSTTIGGTLTGRGGDIILIDDPLKAEEAYSQAQRERVNTWFRETLMSRLDDKVNGAIIVIMQRLHSDDLVGHLTREEGHGWVHLNLPAIAEEEMLVPIADGKVHRRKQGDVLNPAHQPLTVLEEQKRVIGSELFNAQYQQQPVPPGGNMFKRKWFRSERPSWVDREEAFIISLDTANKATEMADYSVATVWAVRGDAMHLMHVMRERLEFPDLRWAILELWGKHPNAELLIEEAGSGISLIAQFKHDGYYPVAITPQGEKSMRAMGATAAFESGAITFEPNAPWTDDLIAELLAFPGGRHDDQVDSVVQAITWWRKYQTEAGYWGTLEM